MGFVGKRVYSLEQVANLPQDYSIVIAVSEQNTPFVVNQLTQLGYILNKNVFLMKTFLSIYLSYAKNKMYMNNCTISITEKCTLNCEKCSILTPYLKSPGHHNLDNLKREADTLFAAVDVINSFGLIGGEPFLYPDFMILLAT